VFSKPITWLSFALLAAVVFLVLLAQRALLGTRAAESAVTPTPTAALAADIVIPPASIPASDFTLHDQDGKAVSVSAFRGRVVAITFLDSHCKQLCPLEADQLAQAQHSLGTASTLPLLVVSVAPATDTPESERAFAALHHWTGEWHWLTGAPDQLAAVWKAYSIAVQGSPDNVLHSTVVYLVDKHGFQRAGWAAGLQPDQLARDVRFLDRAA
jgi:cytochrome oxidase Cu insertion factor (SCO1/SenC/PrrC family)